MAISYQCIKEKLGPIDLSLLGPRLSADELKKLSIFDLLGYIGATDLHPGGKSASEELLGLANIKRGQRVLEIGCGCGSTTSYLAELGCEVLALDRSHYMLDACAKRRIENGNISLLFGDITEHIEIPSGSVDLIVCEGVMGFVIDRFKAFRQARRLVKHDGLMTSIEFYYTNHPSDQAVHFMTESLRLNKPMLLSDWYRLLSDTGWHIVNEKTYMLPSESIHNPSYFPEIAEQLENFLNEDKDAAKVLRKRFDEYENAASFNRRHLAFAARLLKPV